MIEEIQDLRVISIEGDIVKELLVLENDFDGLGLIRTREAVALSIEDSEKALIHKLRTNCIFNLISSALKGCLLWN